MSSGSSTFSLEASGGMFAPLFQPAFAMCAATVFLMITTQSAPRVFLPPKYVGIKVGGLKVQRWVMLPMATISMLYAAAAEQVACGNPVRGHVGGCVVSAVATIGCLVARSYSGWFWPIGITYATFGQMHHGRRLTQLTDGASWYNWGDFTHMRAYRKRMREYLR